jgi:preprotein translocase subunit Sec61beta
VPTAAAAVRGSSPDPSGEVYGVVGISASPSGAGVAAANTGGGADLVLDGSADSQADTRITQSGIDRPSPTQQFFNIDNSGGGGIVVEIDGSPVLTDGAPLDAGNLASGTVPGSRLAGTYGQALALTNPGNAFTGSGAGLTGVDAATLDGVDGAVFATDAEAAAMVAAHAASAAHDPRYYTKTQLNTSGAGGAVHWGNLTAVPAGFADGVDDDTTYNAGPGIVVDGDVIRVDPGAFHTRLSTLDSTGRVGEFSAVAIGADGLGLISYFDNTNDDLKVAHCNDTACSSATTATIDSAGDVGSYTSIAIGADGLGLISYLDITNDNLKVAHCSDIACSSATTATIDSTGNLMWDTSIAIGADGLGLISYYDNTNGDLKVAHCTNVACSSATTATIDSTGEVGSYNSITIGADGLGLISYYHVFGDLKAAHCSNTACSSATTATLDSTGNVGHYTSIAIGADGLGLISYFDDTNSALKIARCSDFTCSSATTATIDNTDFVGASTSIAIGADGLGLISYYDGTNGALKIARCSNVACSSATTAIVDSAGWVGYATSIAIGTDGLGLISYWDYTNEDLKVAHLGIGVP